MTQKSKLSIYKEEIESICCTIEETYRTDTIYQGGVDGCYILTRSHHLSDKDYKAAYIELEKCSTMVKILIEEGYIDSEEELWK